MVSPKLAASKFAKSALNSFEAFLAKGGWLGMFCALFWVDLLDVLNIVGIGKGTPGNPEAVDPLDFSSLLGAKGSKEMFDMANIRIRTISFQRI